MAKGRKPIPDAIKRKTGTYRKDQDPSNGSMHEALEKLPPPETEGREGLISKRAQTHYSQISGEMLAVSKTWLSETDLNFLVVHCNTFDLLVTSITNLKKHGQIDEKGRVSGYLSAYLKLQKAYLDGCVQLGLTPSAKTKIVLEKKEKEINPLDNIII